AFSLRSGIRQNSAWDGAEFWRIPLRWRMLGNDPMSTPMMQQYRDAKDRHPGMLLLFRMGDFYELFDADAETGARVLGLTLTSRDKTIPMAGFPHHQLESYLQK